MAATPLTAPRSGSCRAINRDLRPLAAGARVWKGGLAACVNGYFQAASGSPSEVVVGRFYSSKDNTAGSAGALSADVKFFNERNLFLLDNDTTNPVVVASREMPCSTLDDHTATLYTLGASQAGIVYDVTSDGVWVEIDQAAASYAASGSPTVQKGTTTLVAGTKSVTGVTLTAGSSIQLTIRDPGAGALTTFIGLDAPVAGRNTAAGSFTINALANDKTTLATAVCTVDFVIVG